MSLIGFFFVLLFTCIACNKLKGEYGLATNLLNWQLHRCKVPPIENGAVQYWGSIVLPNSAMMGVGGQIQPVGALMVLYCKPGYSVNGLPGIYNQSAFCLSDGNFMTPIGFCQRERLPVSAFELNDAFPMTTTLETTTEETETTTKFECHEQFTCVNGRCVPFTLILDGHNDCGDESDEMEEASKWKPTTPAISSQLSEIELLHENLSKLAVQGDTNSMEVLMKDDSRLNINWEFFTSMGDNAKHCVNVAGGTILLRAAACNQNYSIIKFLIESGANVNARDLDGWSALMFASFHSNVAVMRLLINWGADVDVRASSGCCPGFSALMISVAFGDNADSVKFMMIRRADMEARDNVGNTPLILAAEIGRLDIVKILADAGAEIDARNWRNESGLMLAARNQKIETVKLLLRLEANRSGCNHFLCKIY